MCRELMNDFYCQKFIVYKQENNKNVLYNKHFNIIFKVATKSNMIQYSAELS